MVLTHESAKYEDYADEIFRRCSMTRLLDRANREMMFARNHLNSSFRLGLIDLSEYNREIRKLARNKRSFEHLVYKYTDAPIFRSTAKVINRVEEKYCKMYAEIRKIGEYYSDLTNTHQPTDMANAV